MENVFSPFNTQIVFSTIACLISIVIAIIPEQVRLTRNNKVILIILPLVLNAIQGIYVVVDIYLTGTDTNSIRWSEQTIGQFIKKTDLISFGKHLFVISLIAMVLMYILIKVKKRTNFNDKQLLRYYVKLTDAQREGGPIIIIGGSMDFLGKSPCDKVKEQDLNCDQAFKGKTGILKKAFADPECIKCCINNEQWKQLTRLVKRGCRIQIVCSHPNNTVNEKEAKELLGFLLKTWKKSINKSNIQVFFFEADKDPNIRGRIIEDFNHIKRVCWNFKNTNKKLNSYEMPFTYSQNDRMGALIIRAFDAIQKEATKITKEEETEYIEAFTNRYDETSEV